MRRFNLSAVRGVVARALHPLLDSDTSKNVSFHQFAVLVGAMSVTPSNVSVGNLESVVLLHDGPEPLRFWASVAAAQKPE